MKQFGKKVLCFVIFLLITTISQILGSLLVDTSASSWYKNLNLPSWTPPGIYFSVVWTVLYVLIALCGTTLWLAKKNKFRAVALTFWGLQMFFNCIWTPIFFGYKAPLIALYDLSLTWVCALLCMIIGWKVRKLAFFLFIPYLLWLGFALILNSTIVYLN